MEFLKELNVVEILKIGSIGLGFLLALMSYMLIKNEQAKKTPNKALLGTAKLFMVFSILIMFFGVISEFVKSNSSLKLGLGSYNVSINELRTTAISALDSKEYFISSEFGFAIKKPNKNWTQIKSEKGVEGLFKIVQVKSKLINLETLNRGIKASPFGEMFAKSTLYYFENTQSKESISVTDSSGNDLINYLIEKRRISLIDTGSYLSYDTTDIEDKKELNEEISEYRRAIIGFDTVVAKEAFLLSIYPKSSLPDYLKKVKLPGFYTTYSIALGANMDKLVANEKQILAGAEITISNMKFKKGVSTYQNKKWLMFTENENFFFVTEISYSPQISSTTDLWDDLQECLNSFTLLAPE